MLMEDLCRGCSYNDDGMCVCMTICPKEKEFKKRRKQKEKEMAIDILEFIKRNYEKHLNEEGQVGCQKYIEALQMGIDALLKDFLSEKSI